MIDNGELTIEEQTPKEFEKIDKSIYSIIVNCTLLIRKSVVQPLC